MMKKALITGINGQDGVFLTMFLINKGYEVHGLIRRNSQNTIGNLNYLDKSILNNLKLHWGDITDASFVSNIIKEEQFDEIYHLAAQSFVALSFKNPSFTYDVNIGGTLNLINAVKDYSSKSKVYFAATSELFGKVKEMPQNENTLFHPRSPYGVSKLAGFWSMVNYRESYGLFFSNGILFNHESEIRGAEFVTRKISLAIANILNGNQEILEIGNVDAKRDWGYSPDYVEGMWKILQSDGPDDFVLATGETHTIREFIEVGFKIAGIDIQWRGEGVNEEGIDKNTGKVLIRVNPEYFRPAEVDVLVGDYSKAKEKLNWEPKTKFYDLVEKMVNFDLGNLKNKKTLDVGISNNNRYNE
jgi:GDPmannose 4,6-dehydratase